MYAVIKCAIILCAAFAANGLDVNNVIFHLYTRSNPTTSEPLIADTTSIMTSSISLQRPIYFTIHNFAESASSNFNAFVVPSLLTGINANVIAVDWSAGSSSYSEGLYNTRVAGDVVAQFINILIDTFGYSADQITIVGLGLGAHTAGIAGRLTSSPIHHIVAIDPSLIGWTHHPDILSPNAASLVEVLHTTSGIRGYDNPLGHLDFYPNGGRQQAGCLQDNVDCSYAFGYIYYSESVTSSVNNGPQFLGTQCDDHLQAFTAQCTGARDVVFGGLDDKAGSSGVYSFLTNYIQPYARD